MDLLDGIDFACPDCGHRSRYPLVHGGKSVACPSCKREHVIPAKGEGSGSGSGRMAVAPPAPPAAPTVAKPAKPNTQPLADAEKILFVCASCQYRARIPAQYAGMAVRCPSCDTAQIANADATGGSTGNTVQLSKIPTAGHKTTIRPGNVLFICSLCNFEAQLAKHYVGKAIRCPGCHAPQVVAGEPPPKDPVALERNPAAAAEAAPAGDPRFICVGCGYRARIPSQYMGLAVTCPKCDTVQIATPEDQEGPSTGDTVAISKMKTAEEGAKLANPQVTTAPGDPQIKPPMSRPASPPTPQAMPKPPAVSKPSGATAAAGGGDKVRFTCSACGFKARIPSTYAGENIHCPGCNAVQLVLRSGQLSPNATGNTQIIQVVQTADAVGSPDAIATPTHTPAQGLPVISDAPSKPSPPPVAKPAAPVAKPANTTPKPPSTFTTPPPAVPVAQPAGTAAAEATIDDLLRFDDPPADEPAKPAGKVVRRGSDRLPVVGAGKSATPAQMAKTPLPAKPATPPPEAPKAPLVMDDEPPSDPLPAPSAPAAKGPNKPPLVKAPPFVAKGAGKPAPRPETAEPMPERAPAKSSNAPLILIAVFGLAILGGGGYFGMEMMKKMDVMSVQLQETKDELRLANEKLTKAEKDTQAAKEDAKLAKEASDLAAKKQAEEAELRKASDAKAAELEAKLKAAEEAAEKAAADAKAAAEAKPAPAETPK